MAASIEDIFCATSRGRIHCRAAGSGRGLFLMHSNGLSAYEFDPLAAELADGFRVVSWDMPGHGDSDRGRGHVDVAGYADLAVEIAGKLFDAPPIVGGSSIGATLAIATGVGHPGAVAGILPIELPLSRGSAWWAANWGMVETMFAIPDEPIERVRSRYRHVTDDHALRLRIDRHKAGGAAMMDVIWTGREYLDGIQDAVRALAVPALFVNGDRGVSPEAAELLPRLNPEATLAIVPDSGHFPQTDAPEIVAAAIRAKFGA